MGGDSRMAKLEAVPEESMTMKAQLDELIAYKKAQLATLGKEVAAAQIELASTKEQCRQERIQAKYDRDVEQMKFQDGLRAQSEATQAERRGMEGLSLELEGQKKELEILEAKAEPVRQALNQLADERLAVEQQRMRNVELQQANEQLQVSIETSQEALRQLDQHVKGREAKAVAQLQEQEIRQQVLDKQAKDIATQLENLTALKTTIDPKLAEVTKLQQQAEHDLTQAKTIQEAITAQQADLEKQRTDLAILSSQLQAKAEALTEHDIRMKQFEAELRIKAQQAKAAGLTVSEFPVKAEEPPA